MGRPQIKGLSYFPHDTHFHEDIKVRKLVKRYGGGTAAYIYLTLLEKIYSQGYYLEFQEDDYFIMAEIVYEEEEFVHKVLKGCIELGLFDKEMYEKYGVITSRAIQQRYVEIKKLLQRKVEITEYNLLTPAADGDSQPAAADTVPSVPVAGKAPKEGKKKKEAGKHVAAQPSRARPCPAGPDTAEDRPGTAEGCDFDFENGMNQIRSEDTWLSDFSKVYSLPPDVTSDMLERFSSFCRLNDKTQHADLQDLKDHLMRWVCTERKNNFIIRKTYRNKQTYDGTIPTAGGTVPDRRRSFAITHELPETSFTGSF